MFPDVSATSGNRRNRPSPVRTLSQRCSNQLNVVLRSV
eukprot:COSAG02_NODE_18005_length_966_cov_1.316032_1_plen_37_part_10